MKKKLLSVLLCASMAASMLAGCGGNSSDANSNAADQCRGSRNRDSSG